MTIFVLHKKKNEKKRNKKNRIKFRVCYHVHDVTLIKFFTTQKISKWESNGNCILYTVYAIPYTSISRDPLHRVTERRNKILLRRIYFHLISFLSSSGHKTGDSTVSHKLTNSQFTIIRETESVTHSLKTKK